MNKPEKQIQNRQGLLHIIDAAGFSMAGLRRLWRETAFKLEVGVAVLAIGAVGFSGAAPAQIFTLGSLFLMLFATEALNTAIEEIVDRISPEWSLAARNAKDLGSLAVGLVSLVVAGYIAFIFLDL
ncbi:MULTISPECIES: diacylglycerol kinase [unclassified Roseobacter]|uniref:diacylglycerol kinase n=1 Tax=unclassified Roseobacter TaxID=196798 RepID=UPI0030EC96C4